ncbi:MAG: hypothetical protein QF877_17600 [Gammaproteobacteria bacterium]|mgnify:CR=1 FL=1|jgi:hypothetical protein|nr:hypothetical protein [Gammaproteobacteria bacterium]
MNKLWLIILSIFLLACEGESASAPSGELDTADPDAVASFNLRSGERRELFLTEAEKRNVEVWINNDGSIGHYVADDKQINDIFTYIRAVIWVNN